VGVKPVHIQQAQYAQTKVDDPIGPKGTKKNKQEEGESRHSCVAMRNDNILQANGCVSVREKTEFGVVDTSYKESGEEDDEADRARITS
jgi:hypothetical protein